MGTIRYELIRDWETPFTKFYKGHCNTPEVWAQIFGVTEIEFHEQLINGTFRDWLKIEILD